MLKLRFSRLVMGGGGYGPGINRSDVRQIRPDGYPTLWPRLCMGLFSDDGWGTPSIVRFRGVILGKGEGSLSASTIWHSLRKRVSQPEVWLAECLCESNEPMPNRRLVKSAKDEEQRFRIRTSQGASIDGKNLNTLGRRQLFRLS